jgi:putative salt-induced outer membrane protein YdiY
MDWIRLTSGEWLAGELKGLRDTDLEFDSEKLDLLKIDWNDVVELRSPRILTYSFDGMGNFTGSAAMRDSVVVIATLAGVVEKPRQPLLLILEGGQREIDYWSVRASLGLVTRTGNTAQSDFNTDARIRRTSPSARFTLSYTGNYGKVENERTIENHNTTAAVDIVITAGFYVTAVSANFFIDNFQNIDLKSTIGAGLGYAVFRGGDFEWSVGLGGAYTKTEYVSVQPDQEISETNAAIVPSTEIEWDITGDIEFVLAYNAQIGVPDLARTYHHGKVAFSFDILGDILDLDWGLNWDRVESPQPDAEGNTPVRDDLRTTLGIGIDW